MSEATQRSRHLACRAFGAAGDLFIRPYAVQAAHEQVAVDERAERIHQQAGGGAEARILFSRRLALMEMTGMWLSRPSPARGE